MADHWNAYLELSPHTRDHTPENLHTRIKYLRNRAYSISTQGQAKILIDRLCECRRFVRGTRMDDCRRINEETHVRVQNR